MFQACAPSSPSLDLELTSHIISVLFQCERIPTNRVWKDTFLYLPRDQARLCFLNRINVGIWSVSFQGDRAETLKWCTLFSWVKDCMVMMHHVNGDNKMQLTWWYDANQSVQPIDAWNLLQVFFWPRFRFVFRLCSWAKTFKKCNQISTNYP